MIIRCASHVGRTGGRQPLYVGKGCQSDGMMMHEIGHALGFFHEQSRIDRDLFITVNFNNIKQSKQEQKYYTAPLSDTLITNTMLTPWKKGLKNQGLFNTLDTSRTPHHNLGKSLNTSITPQKISPTLNKMDSHQHPQKRDQKSWRVLHLNNLKSFIIHSGTSTYTLPTPQKFSSSPC